MARTACSLCRRRWVNAPREMKIAIASSKIEAVADVTVTDLDLDDLVTAR